MALEGRVAAFLDPLLACPILTPRTAAACVLAKRNDRIRSSSSPDAGPVVADVSRAAFVDAIVAAKTAAAASAQATTSSHPLARKSSRGSDRRRPGEQRAHPRSTAPLHFFLAADLVALPSFSFLVTRFRFGGMTCLNGSLAMGRRAFLRFTSKKRYGLEKSTGGHKTILCYAHHRV